MAVRTETLYSSTEACRLADISFRQLDYWCRLGTITPGVAASGPGSRRRWTVQEVHVLTVLAAVGGHVPISALDELGAVLLDWDASTWDGVVLIVSRTGSIWVWGDDDDEVPSVATTVNLGALRRQVSDRLTPLTR